MGLTLVLLAAGKGSRYGALKQIQRFGCQNATLSEFALFDALRHGFENFLAVVNQESKGYFEALFKRIGLEKKSHCIVQCNKAIPFPTGAAEKRTKPWGTGHALWCIRDHVNTPFVVINADDFYGQTAYEKVAHFLRGETKGFGLVTYSLKTTLSPYGAVSRAICHHEKGQLQQINEHTAIESNEKGILSKSISSPGSISFTGEEAVSVNFWALQPSVFLKLEEVFTAFLCSQQLDPINSEFYLPNAVERVSRLLRVPIMILPNDRPDWMGVTYPQDNLKVNETLKHLTLQGVYPNHLWDQASSLVHG